MWQERVGVAMLGVLAAASGCNALWGVDKLEYDRWNDVGCGSNRYPSCERPPPEATGGAGGAG